MEPFCRDLLKPESRKHAAARAAEQIGERVGERQHIVPPIDEERHDAERQDDADGGREGELIRQTDEPDEQRDEHHAAARAEKSVDKARGETREQTFPEGDVFLFHKKYLRKLNFRGILPHLK